MDKKITHVEGHFETESYTEGNIKRIQRM